MGNPFQDQLLKAGLVNKKQANKAKREQHQKRKKGNEKAASPVSDAVREKQQKQAEQNRLLNQKKSAAQQEKETKAQIRQLIEQNKLELDDRGKPYHFVEEKKIQRIFVSEEMTEQLSRGQLAIVAMGNNHAVVPAKTARQIRSRCKESILAFFESDAQ